MVQVSTNPNIELLTYSEVEHIDGFVGNFKVKVRKKQTWVDWKKCTGCGECMEKCPVKVPNEFNAGLDHRPAVYIQFPQAVPKKAVIDIDNCINCAGRKFGTEPKISKRTGKPILAPCERACPAGAINRSLALDPEGEVVELDVGTIVVATGFKVMEKDWFKEYAPHHPDVMTALQFERLLSATGPTGGKLVRPSTNEKPKVISFISCVGSRDHRYHTYCSRVCCMYMIKQAKLIKDKYPDIDIYMHFMDVRTPGKDFDEYYTSAIEKGINIVRGKPGGIEVLPDGRLRVMAYDAGLGKDVEVQADMVILATAIEVPDDAKKLAQTLHLTIDGSGFFKELHPKLKPVETAVEGIYLAGCCQGPKDIPDTVAQAKGAAAAAAVPLARGKVVIEPTISEVDQEKCSGCGLCVAVCPYQAITMELVNDRPRAKISVTACKGCGVCTSTCPSEAIILHGFTDKQIEAQVEALTMAV